jgi:hypothetical protein
VGQLLDAGFVADRRVAVRPARRRIERLDPPLAVDVVKVLGLRVPGLEVGVAERPRRRDAVDVLDRTEVALAHPEQHRAVDLGVAADVVVLLGVELLAVLVGPVPGVAVAQVAPDRHRAPVLLLPWVPATALQQQHPFARRCQRPGERAAAGAGPDDDDVVVLGHVVASG